MGRIREHSLSISITNKGKSYENSYSCYRDTLLRYRLQWSQQKTYQVSITNNLEDELIAPVLLTSPNNDQQIFSDDYVTAETEDQILTGDPAHLAGRISENRGTSYIVHSVKHESGTLLKPGATITFEISTNEKSLRILAMVAPTKTPDNYVTGIINIDGPISEKSLTRYDIGHDEGRRTRQATSNTNAVTVVIVKK